METSVAQQISLQVNSRYVTPAVVQSLLALSRPVREAIQTFFDSVEISIQTQRSATLQKLITADKLSQATQVIMNAVNKILEPVDNLMSAIPLDSVAAESPEISEVLKSIQDSVPLRIDSTTATVVMGVGGMDFFDGISSYRDLRNKIDDLESRLVRATSMRNYASKGLSYLDNQLDKIRAYRQVITLLND
jgi:hypothetical protein